MNIEKNNYSKVPIEQLRWNCCLAEADFTSTDDLEACDEILGQERALKALELGLDMEYLGYNIFITGKSGTGRSSTIRMLLQDRKRKDIIFDDKCYVHNFKDPDMPKAISLPAGKGNQFKKDMENLVLTLRKHVPSLLESDRYQRSKDVLTEGFKKKQQTLIKEFEDKVKAEKFTIVQVQIGPYTRPDIFPVIDDKPINLENLEALVVEGKLSKDELDKIKIKHQEFTKEITLISKKINILQKDLNQKLIELDIKMITPLVEEETVEIKKKYNNRTIDSYLNEVKKTVLENISRFQDKEEQPATIPGLKLPQIVDTFLDFSVNVIVDNSDTKTSPVIIETNPSYKNLFGMIERRMDRTGYLVTDFTKIKVGSLLKANGGFLVVNALDVLIEPGVWPALKRTLLNQKIEPETYDPFPLFSTSALKPEPVECNVKVIMIGDPFLYQLLYFRDQDFEKIFKIKADFDSVTENNNHSIYQYSCFIKRLCERENLLPFAQSGIEGVIEYAVRLTERKNKLSTHFNKLVDLLRESDYWAKQDQQKIIEKKHVTTAIKEKIERLNLIENKIQEMIEEGTLMIDTEGSAVGQVNGLSVYDMGEYSFGKPTRITAKTSIGRAGIINIEREADLSGKTHNKGVLILSGYLRSKYAQDKPLTISASICFEQSYSGVEGDSASSTEAYALISSIANIPIRQDIAVTGSINQNGEIQPIGGVNQKIEGFFDVCRAKGLTGTQGVLIPALNIPDLMLREDVVEAIKNGQFHLYAVKSIDQGIELLTGRKAGKREKSGQFEKNTINYLVDQKLLEFALKIKEFGEEKRKK
ncbi:MAG TPA: ATP-binding protein [Atribacterota bacterium]|nr:ATP-binding protein [Atribacterota bacterium]HOR41735.1 ATP-binding protein [Atribacterota bacterium]